MEEEFNAAASAHISLWKSSKCFCKPLSLAFLLKFPENPPPCCMCLYFIQSLCKGRIFFDGPSLAEGPGGFCAPCLRAGKHHQCPRHLTLHSTMLKCPDLLCTAKFRAFTFIPPLLLVVSLSHLHGFSNNFAYIPLIFFHPFPQWLLFGAAFVPAEPAQVPAYRWMDVAGRGGKRYRCPQLFGGLPAVAVTGDGGC